MRLSAFLFGAVAFASVGIGALGLSRTATAFFERDARARLAEGLTASGEDWARIEVDGLRVVISGEAPDETSRFRAIETARQIVDPNRIEDATSVAAADPLTPPPFALELLRNDAEISLIGLVPDGAGRSEIARALSREALGGSVTDMLETARAPAPDGWSDALALGLDLLTTLPRAKISVAPGAVTVTATAETDEARAALETRLRALGPDGLELTLDLSAPRPVIAPFRVTFERSGGAAFLKDCAAETEEDAAIIVVAARAAGHAGDADCPVGLGAPTPDWARGIVAGIDAVKALGGGRFAVSDVEAVLTGPPEVDADDLAAAGDRLRAALPTVISLKTLAPPRMVETDDGQTVYAPRFEASLGADGNVVLTGALQSETSRAAVASYAAALFGHDRVTSETVVDPALPEGWPGRVLAGIDALSRLKEGGLSVTLDEVALDGRSIEKDSDAILEALFAEKLATPARVDVSYDAEASAIAARTRPEICADEIAGIMESETIKFDAGSSTIAPESLGVIAAVADVLRTCPGSYFEIGGHTDAQGRAEVNQRLSEERAEAVMTALEDEALPLILLSARGYGAERPVADNATADGRSRNRRIEITLVDPEDIGAEEAVAVVARETDTEACAADLAVIVETSPIQFAAGSSEIAEGSAETLDELAEALAACPGAAFEIGGHTDDQGPAEVNERLSRERAEAVMAALETGGLVADVTLTATGYGSSQPVADNGTAEGRERNRRIELTPVGVGPADGVLEGAESEAVPDVGTIAANCAADVAAILEADGVQFDLGSSAIAAESAGTVDALKAALAACGGGTFEISGHTDDRGSSEGNMRLSRARAEAVLAALEADGPLEGVTLVARGYGEDAPIADNATSEGRSANRRIEIRPLSARPDDGAATDSGDETGPAAETEIEAAGDES